MKMVVKSDVNLIVVVGLGYSTLYASCIVNIYTYIWLHFMVNVGK